MPERASEEDFKQALLEAKFDAEIINNAEMYIRFKEFLESNLDTIIKYRYLQNTATVIRGKNFPDTTILVDDNCYDFFQGNERYDITNVPDFLKNKIDSFFYSFDENEITSFSICKDKYISIYIKREESKNGLLICHFFTWNNDLKEEYYGIDTLIASDCLYSVEIGEYSRH